MDSLSYSQYLASALNSTRAAGLTGGAAPLVPNRFIGRTLSLFRHRSVDPTPLIQRFVLPKSVEQDPLVLLPIAEIERFGAEAERLLDEPFVGIRAAQLPLHDMHTVIAFACSAGPDGGTALRRYASYFNAIHGSLVMSVESTKEGALLRHRAPGHPDCLGRHGNEQWMVAVVLASRAVVEAQWAPLSVTLAHGDSKSRDELCRILGTSNVSFGGGENTLLIHQQDLDRPLRDRDSPLASLLSRYALNGTAATAATAGFRGRIREALEKVLPSGQPPISAVARLLGMSGRTLQRRLSERSLTFQGVLDELRRDVAIAHVRRGSLPIESIAEILGYAQSTAFFRAFRRWTGTTPRAMRDAGEKAPTNLSAVLADAHADDCGR